MNAIMGLPLMKEIEYLNEVDMFDGLRDMSNQGWTWLSRIEHQPTSTFIVNYGFNIDFYNAKENHFNIAN